MGLPLSMPSSTYAGFVMVIAPPSRLEVGRETSQMYCGVAFEAPAERASGGAHPEYLIKLNSRSHWRSS